MGLEFVKVEKSKPTVINTCAFDNIYQIMLVAATNNRRIWEYIEIEEV